MTDLTCKQCKGTGKTTREAFTYTDSRTGQQTHYPEKIEACHYCDGKGQYPELDTAFILAAIKGRKGGRDMTHDPVLAARSFAKGHEGSRVALSFRVEGGLHYLKGNNKPYFSLTYTEHRKGFPNQCYSGGAGHDKILKYFPRFADLAALHLSDIDGVPMHAEANGWYWLSGYLGGMGEEYHGGSGQFGKTPEQCLEIFARHCRISIEEARALADKCREAKLPNGWGADVHCAKASRDVWRAACEAMRPRWKAEADACIANHKLAIYGDAWQAA